MTGRRRKHTVETAPTPRRLATLVLVFAVLMMPVSYRAGTDVAHPHSFLQFLTDAAAGAMNHHLVKKGHGEHVEMASQETAAFNTAPPGTPALDKLGPANERSSALGIALFTAWLALALGRGVVLEREEKLIGIVPRPPEPPPRIGLVVG